MSGYKRGHLNDVASQLQQFYFERGMFDAARGAWGIVWLIGPVEAMRVMDNFDRDLATVERENAEFNRSPRRRAWFASKLNDYSRLAERTPA